MTAHASLSMELPPKAPPPAVSNNNSYSPVTSASPVSNVSSPRIRRKPLPPTAFSPRSVVSSPKSILSEIAAPAPSDISQSAAVLNEVLHSPSHKLIAPSRGKPPIPDVPLSVPGNRPAFREPPYDPPVADLLLPPSRDVGPQQGINEEPYVALTYKEDMATKMTERPPPLRMESIKAVKALDAKKPQSPGSVFTSFFSRKATASPQNISPSVESSATDISDTQSASPYPTSPKDSSYFTQQRPAPNTLHRQSSWQSSQSSINYNGLKRINSGASGPIGPASGDLATRSNMLEAELKDISRELAGSIRRELDLEDLVERLQSEAPRPPMSVDRTSDYFSDSGTSSVRNPGSEFNVKEEMDKIKRESEQQRAQLKIDLSQKWQNEIAQKRHLEAHVQILENKLSQSRQNSNETSDASARIRELEVLLDDARRRLVEERQTKENFEDLLTALRVELEQHRNERDNLRDEIVPNLNKQIEGLETSFGDTQKQVYDFARMQQEIQNLRDENAAISSARKMEQEMMRTDMQFMAGDGMSTPSRLSLIVPKSGGLTRSSTVSNRGQTTRPGSIARANSILSKQLPETPESLADRLTATEQQRDALHSAVKYLRTRYHHQTRMYEKKVRGLESQVEKLSATSDESKRGGYAREVRTLRQEINLLRKRADDALDQKWQCEKGLSGLKMDLDRSKQETASLQKLLQARGSDDPELLSTALENAMNDLQQTRAREQDTVASLEYEQQVAHQLEESAERAEALAIQVRKQLDTNSALRARLTNAVAMGERNQQASALQINSLQAKLKSLEDTIMTGQLQSETVVMKHEEEIKNLTASHNASLMRAKAGIKSPQIGNGQASPLSPMFAVKSPRLDNTTSGPGMSLNQALKTEVLEQKVTELERALGDAERGMEEVVGRMNQAQIGVFELQQERDEAHRRTRQLESEVKAERERFQSLVARSMK